MTDDIGDPTLRTIWETLSKIDCSEHTEDKGGLTYLSWAWCWQLLVENFPFAQYEFADNETHADGSMTVHCTVIIGACRRSMWLPVMDHRNRALVNPDSRSISDSKMRCLTKCIAMFGLGHYIYAGEDLPVSPQEENGDETPRKESTQTKGKENTPPAASAEPEQGNGDFPFDPKNEEGGRNWARWLEENLFNELEPQSLEGLHSYWDANKSGVEWLGKEFPDIYEEVQGAFSQALEKIEAEGEEE